jgi:hypothetical protein
METPWKSAKTKHIKHIKQQQIPNLDHFLLVSLDLSQRFTGVPHRHLLVKAMLFLHRGVLLTAAT